MSLDQTMVDRTCTLRETREDFRAGMQKLMMAAVHGDGTLVVVRDTALGATSL
jgi:hypothetical protein